MFLFEEIAEPKKMIIPEEYSFENLIKWLNDNTRFDQYKPKHTTFYRIKSTIEEQGKVGKVTVDQEKDGTPIYEDIPQKQAVVHYVFGSNGPGLSNEMLAIGEDIKHWCKYYYITISDKSAMDPLDDVYDIYVTYQEREYELNEGASGYYPKDSDEYWDEASNIKKLLLDRIIKNLKITDNKHTGWLYTYMGLTNAILSADHLFTLYANDILTQKLIKAFNKAYNLLASDTENLMGWRDFNAYKNALKNVKYEFDKLMINKYDISKDELDSILKED